MARGQSGRVVLEIDPTFKRRLHAQLAADGRTLKDWFVEQAERYLDHAVQQTFPWATPPGHQPAQGEAPQRSAP